MRKSMTWMLFLLMATPVVAVEPTLLVLDAKEGWSDHLESFRTMKSPWVRTEGKLPDREGLEDLKISGSSEFSCEGIETIRQRIPAKKIVVVDLRQESHGMVNGLPVSWEQNYNRVNAGKEEAEVAADESSRLRKLMRAGRTLMHRLDEHWSRRKLTPVRAEVTSVATEQEVVRAAGMDYERFAVTDHGHPDDEDVDRFVAVYSGAPTGTWFHFHCKAGVGRTTVFMAMADMMKNAKKVSLEDILDRQARFIQYDFRAVPPKDSWKYPIVKARDEFLALFYRYCRANAPNFPTSFTGWKRRVTSSP
jgi:hypothetical protein